MPSFVRPPRLSADTTITLFAASSPFDRTRFDRGLALLEQRYRTRLGPSLFARQGFLAAHDDGRLADLKAGLDAADVGALVAARGGYGATRLLPALSVDDVRRAGKWLVGFSDVTALHALWARAGLCSLHGPMVCSLPDGSAALQERWWALLEGARPGPLGGLRCVRRGRARGRLFGGNLTVLGALVGTPYMPPLDDVVLVLEDISERPYRLDRMLTTMLQAGFFAGIRAIVLGQFSECAPGPDGIAAEHVLEERLGGLGIPLLADAPFGHIAENTPLLLGARAEVDADAGEIHFAAP